MGTNVFGRYISKKITSTLNIDLIDTLSALVGDTIIVRKLTLISNGTTTVSINGGVLSDLYIDLDGNSHLSLDSNDILVNSLVVAEAGLEIFIAVIY